MLMKDALVQLVQEVLAGMGVAGVVPDVTISDDPVHGEYTTNIAMKLAKTLKKSPMDIALQVKNALDSRIKTVTHDNQDHNIIKIDHNNTGKKQKVNQLQDSDDVVSAVTDVLSSIDRVEIVPPGFLNVFLRDFALSSRVQSVLKDAERYGSSQTLIPLDLHGEADGNAKRIMVEFAHPNTHKAFHIGHLRNITTGESVVRLLEASAHTVIRANYQGDVGMHIAKAIYGLGKVISEMQVDQELSMDQLQQVYQKIQLIEQTMALSVRIELLGRCYAVGSKAYEESPLAKKVIGEINKIIYSRDAGIFKIYYDLYQLTRKWSLEYFDSIYKRVGTHYDRLYFESETYESGKKNVLEGLKKGIFEKSDGAIIFPGEKYGLHTRVFITKEGNATYEGKDMGLAPLQHKEYHPDLILHVLGPEQYSYTRVMFKALDLLFPVDAHKQFHKVYGWVKLKHGKMSSRTGQVVLGEWLLDEAKRSIYEILKQSKTNYTKEEQDEIAEKGAIAAVKYAFLKVSTNQEIAFDLKESVSFDGDSGPYLLYSYARCKSVLRKAGIAAAGDGPAMTLNPEEKALARHLYFFPEIVAEAAGALSPNVLCTYLFTLGQTFNLFYQKHPIIGQPHRLALTAATAQVLNNGLYLLGISTVERM